MQPHIFREYDIRGVADRDLTDDVVTRIGHAYAATLRQTVAKPRIAVGRDCRLSGPRIARSLTDGMIAAGARVVDIGVGPTPMTYFAVHEIDADGGVMITGSHNPGDENGFKIMRGKQSFFGAELQALRARIEASDLPTAEGGNREETSIEEAYLGALTRDIELPDTSFGVVIDAGNGAAGPIALAALRRSGFDPLGLYCDMDGTFPNHHPDPTVPENLEELIATVRKQNARVGIAFDGDGDRLGVVDPSGEIVWGDRLLALFARRVLAKRPGAAVLGEVKCSQLLFDDVARHGGRPILWKTGHSLIKTKMKEENALLAGEMSGHFFFADRYFGFDDAPYAALRLLEILSVEGKTVSELLADLPRRHSTPEIRVRCADEVKQAVVARVRERLRGKHELIEIDGVRVQYSDGAWALLRASNTGPILVLRFEAPTDARLTEIRGEIETELQMAQEAVGDLKPNG
jgi:phosphomannomutase/phosphoglucomutase